MRWSDERQQPTLREGLVATFLVTLATILLISLGKWVFSDYRDADTISSISWASCHSMCKSHPMEVGFHSNGSLASCSCDLTSVFPDPVSSQ
jgi:hypothetical protein